MKSKTVLGFGLLTLGALLALSPLALAHGWGGRGPAGPNQAQWQQMTELRNVMHYGVFKAERLPEGVRVTVTSDQPELAQSIGKAFGEVEPDEVLPPQTDTKVTARNDGVTLAFTSKNADTVKALQAQGEGLAFWLLRDRMHDTMTAAGYGPGWRRGGYGPGWGRGSGYGPGGMMGGGYGPGWMHGPRGAGWGGGPCFGDGNYGPGSGSTQD